MTKRIAAAGLLAMAAGAGAQTWNTFGDFSIASNPHGVWTYGWLSNGVFTPFDHVAMLTPDLAVWTGSPANDPCVGINPGPYEHTVPGTTISVPTQSAWARPGPGGEYAVFRFTAPAPGS